MGPPTIVETPTFTNWVQHEMDPTEYRELQLTLLLSPRKGAVIPGSSGLRKLRWKGRSKGTRGGYRVLYFYADAREIILLLDGFSKSERADLSRKQIRELGRAVRREFG